MGLGTSAYTALAQSIAAGGSLTLASNVDVSAGLKIWVSLCVDGASAASRSSILHFNNTGTSNRAIASISLRDHNDAISPTANMLAPRQPFYFGSISSPLSGATSPIHVQAIYTDNANFLYMVVVGGMTIRQTTNIDIVIENGDTVNAVVVHAVVVFTTGS